MGIGGSTITSSRLTIRQPARRVLDLESECDAHTLLPTAHSDRVTATAINHRVVRLANFNSHLNGISQYGMP